MTDPGLRSTPEQEQKKRGGALKWILIIVGVIVVIAVISNIAQGDQDVESEAGDAPTTAEPRGEDSAPVDATEQVDTVPPADETTQESGLRWEAETSTGAPMDITYVGNDFNITQEQGAASPWTATVEADRRTELLGANMSAQNSGGGEVTCRVFWDGELVNENTSSGDYAIATCSLPL